MSQKTITVHVRVDRRMLRAFGLFDTFVLKKRWRQPVVFALILTAFAAACFVSGKPQSALMGGVLLAMGLLLPAVYVLMYLSQLKAQAKALKLDKPRPAYTLRLSDDGVDIHNDRKQEDDVHLGWESLHGAWRAKDAAYLYATPAKAFLLPDGQADADPQAVWAYLCEKLGDRARTR